MTRLLLAFSLHFLAFSAYGSEPAQAHYEYKLDEFYQLKDEGDLDKLTVFLEANGLDMLSHAHPDDAFKLGLSMMSAIRGVSNKDPEWARDPETKAWWHNFSLKMNQLFTGKFYGGPLLLIANDGEHAFVPEDYRHYPAFALMQASAKDKHVGEWAHKEIRELHHFLREQSVRIDRGETTKDTATMELLAHTNLPIRVLLASGNAKDLDVIESLFCIPGFRLAIVSSLGWSSDSNSQNMMERLVKADYTDGERPFVIRALARAAAKESQYLGESRFVTLLESFAKGEPMISAETPENFLPPKCHSKLN